LDFARQGALPQTQPHVIDARIQNQTSSALESLGTPYLSNGVREGEGFVKNGQLERGDDPPI